MRNPHVPALPKLQPLQWVVINKLRATFGMAIPFDRYVDYTNVRDDANKPQRMHFLNVNLKRKPHPVQALPYAAFGSYFNR